MEQFANDVMDSTMNKCQDVLRKHGKTDDGIERLKNRWKQIFQQMLYAGSAESVNCFSRMSVDFKNEICELALQVSTTIHFLFRSGFSEAKQQRLKRVPTQRVVNKPNSGWNFATIMARTHPSYAAFCADIGNAMSSPKRTSSHQRMPGRTGTAMVNLDPPKTSIMIRHTYLPL